MATTQPNREQQDALKEEFADHQIQQIRGFDYVKIGDVINRMNSVLGVGNWSTRIVSKEFDGKEAAVHVSVDALIDGVHCNSDAIGGVKRNPNGLGDTYKGATSDAIKKAVQRFGVGLYLAVDEIPEEVPEPEVDLEDYNKVMAALKTLDSEQKGKAKDWWDTYGNTESIGQYAEIQQEAWVEFKAFIREFWGTPDEEAMSPEAVADELQGELV